MDERLYYEENLKKMKAIAADLSPEDGGKVLHAFEYACVAHANQKRKSGEPYIIHPVEVAVIIHDLGLDTDSIIAGLLHDCIEDTPITYEEVARDFGEPVARLVDGVTRLTKLGHIAYGSREEAQMEDLRKMFVAMAKDIRVIMIKLSDRLHNMRTIQFQSEQKQRDVSVETMEIYAPLAHRLGMQGFKWELEDRSLRVLDPVGYGEIESYLADKSHGYQAFLDHTRDRIEEKMRSAQIDCTVKARLKSVYSIYRKLYGQNLSFSELYDICATRVIVHNLIDCYNVLGLIHDIYKPVPGRFKDYISTPKPNGYQSLHTVVIGNEGIPFEVQIRTEEMDKSAEYGVAAHWKYKDGLRGSQREDSFAWVRQIIETQQDSDAEDFIKNIKTDLFADEVYVFTPKGDVINLPLGATPIDFAYAIHSAVGNRMTGARVNGRLVPIDYKLQSGEIVDVITSRASTGPKRDWMQIVRTNGARSKIKQWFKKERREENIEEGRADLERELRAGLLWEQFQQEDFRQTVLKRLSIPTLDDLYASIGYGGVILSKVIGKIRDESNRLRAQEAKEAKIAAAREVRRKPIADTGVIVEGVDNCMVKFAKCCAPVPGDDIIGFVTRGFGVSIHRKDCPNYQNVKDVEEERGRWILTEWDYSEKHQYVTGLRVVAKARPGVMADVIAVFSNMKLNLTEINARDNSEGNTVFFLSVTVSGREQLELVLNRVRRCQGVSLAERYMTGGENK